MPTPDDEILDLISREIMVDRARLVPSATVENLGIDSIGFVSVVFAVEEKYDVVIEPEKLSDAKTLGDLVDRLKTLIKESPNAAGQ